MLNEEELAQAVAAACLDEKAVDVVILDVSELTIIADYFVIATARSRVQVQSIVELVQERLKEFDISPSRIEGLEQGSWAVMDYSSTILHVFRPEEREYYDLENLWGDAREVDVNESYA
ncbi:MAG: ribosome silencing factor [Syntrophomonas sp.]|uniref:ribosome silencing factor n=1 Tax=Syntrophomonas sp. TaxID=2053627 RepID=UPI0026155211|nr:ribosome silencing factor [Syntrophomonas sp.]MDD2511027.1 ribosome silencing factor [Syntrophomonas sp.]MDD3879272.1 ribosome silencing factor [Syntrophomonas sp.]MDD4627519.1 ribosome silencing factor [Syntrophomonas sp.]